MSTIEKPDASAHPASGCPVAHDFDPFAGLPGAFLEQARKERPVFYHEKLGAYFITRYKDVERVLGDRGKDVSAQNALMHGINVQPTAEAGRIIQESGLVLAPSIVDEDGEEHKRHRRAAQPPFTPAKVKLLEPFIRQQVNAQLDLIVKEGHADAVDQVIYDVPGAVILHMMGIPDEQLGMVKGFRGPWAVFIWGLPDEETQIHTAHGMGEFGAWARGIAQRSLDEPGDDIISEAIKNLRDKGIDFDKEKAEREWLDSYTLNVVMAGHETTVNSLAGGIVELLQNRDQWEALLEDPSLIPNAADEILRYCTGVPTWRQQLVNDVELQGVTLPAGSKVYAAINSANRDEDVFEDGETFDVRRPNANKHLTFGKGAHTCMGNHLAKLEITIMIEELQRRLPHAQLVPDQEWVFSPNTSQRGPEHVRITWDPAQNPVEADRP